MRYTKIPVTIEAERWDGSDKGAQRIVLWILNNGGKARYQSEPRQSKGRAGIIPPHIVIETLEGAMMLWEGDYALKGIKGEFYPHAGSFFLEAYAPAEEDEEAS